MNSSTFCVNFIFLITLDSCFCSALMAGVSSFPWQAAGICSCAGGALQSALTSASQAGQLVFLSESIK